MSKRMPKVGGTFLQAESEIAAINMVLRRGGRRRARHDLAPPRPGISLKGEGISYMAGADLPGVIINVAARRPGPRRHPALPGRLLAGHARRSGHGDFQIIVYAPSTVQEMADYCLRRLRHGRQVPHARHDPGRRHAGPDDGAGGAARAEDRELPDKPWATHGHKGPARAQRGELAVPRPPTTLEQPERGALRSATRPSSATSSAPRRISTEDADVVRGGLRRLRPRRPQRRARPPARQGIKAGLVRPITLWPFPEERPRGHGCALPRRISRWR